MRRQSVPKVEVAPFSPRLEILLQSPEVAPVYDRKLQPLAGIRWTGLGMRRIALSGEVAMFTVTDPGELQEWPTRGETSCE
jgi:hypothetical protein